MKILIPGHRYELANFEQPDQPGQVLQFIQKAADPAGKFLTLNDGTTNEEALRVLIDRIAHLNTKTPCQHNLLAKSHLLSALSWLERRTAERQHRGVEGTQKV